MLNQKHRLVFGLGSGIFYSLGNKGLWKKILPKYIAQFDNDILLSAKDITFTCLDFIDGLIGAKERLYLDSGGFTLYKKEKKLGPNNPEFKSACKAMGTKYLKVLRQVKPKECFELDNDYFKVTDDLLSPKNFLREEVKEIVGYYPTPVFKMFQGFNYWKQLCESELYPRISIGGLAATKSWHTLRDEIKVMMDYARANNKKVHLLGCMNIETFKLVQPDTVDYCIYQVAKNINEAREEHPEFNDSTPFVHLARHATLWGLARAKVRSPFYDSYMVSRESD